MKVVFNPLTGLFDIVGTGGGGGGSGFSWSEIISGNTVRIATHQEMLLFEELKIQDGGELIMEDTASTVIILPYIPFNSRIRTDLYVAHDKQQAVFNEVIIQDGASLELVGELVIFN